MPLEPFKSSHSLTLGVELELQLINLSDFDLIRRQSGHAAPAQAREVPGQCHAGNDREHDRDQYRRAYQSRGNAGAVAAHPRHAGARGRHAQRRHLRRRHPSVPALGGPQDISQAALPRGVGDLWLPGTSSSPCSASTSISAAARATKRCSCCMRSTVTSRTSSPCPHRRRISRASIPCSIRRV